MGTRFGPERVMPPITQAASDVALWTRAVSGADASTSGRSAQVDNVGVVLLSDETSSSEAAPLLAHDALKLAFCGGVSGALAKTCTAPLARLTILYQVHGLAAIAPAHAASAAASAAAAHGARQLGVLAALRHVVAKEGLAALWKGNLVTVMHRIPYSATNFWAYESTKKALAGALPHESARAWAAGAVAGLVACTAAYPLDLLRTRMAAESAAASHRRYAHVGSALGGIVAEHGLVGLYKGLGATLAQVVPGLAFNFCFYDTFKRLALAQQAALAEAQAQAQAGQRQQASLVEAQAQALEAGQQLLHASPQPAPGPWARLQALAGGPLRQRQAQGQQQQQQQQHNASSSSYAAAGTAGAGSGAASCGGSAGQGACGAAGGSDGSCSGGDGGGCGGAAATPPDARTSALCACAAGLCTSTLTFPLDVVRRRLQVYERGPLGRLTYGDVVRQLWAEAGPRAFYRGIGPEYAKVVPGMAIAFTAYETLKHLTGARA